VSDEQRSNLRKAQRRFHSVRNANSASDGAASQSASSAIKAANGVNECVSSAKDGALTLTGRERVLARVITRGKHKGSGVGWSGARRGRDRRLTFLIGDVCLPVNDNLDITRLCPSNK